MESMHELRDMLCEALAKVAGKGELSAGSLDTIHKLTDTIKNIDKIEMLEEGGYSEEGGWMTRGMRGNSYDEGGNSYARRKRDRMGRYSRGGNSYDDGGSYARGGRGGYSRDHGKHHMMEQLEEMMEDAGSEKERQAIQRCMKQLEEA